MPNRFNFYVRLSRRLKETKVERRIYHYSAHDLGTKFNDILYEFWFSYFEKTPWFTKEIIGNLDKIIKKLVTELVTDKDKELKNLALNVTALMSGRTRAFFTTVPNVNFVRKVFGVKSNEEIIPFENQESLNALIISMKNSLGKKIFFILLDEYYQLRIALIQMGFVEGRDFINAAMFLSDANGVTIKTYELVRNM